MVGRVRSIQKGLDNIFQLGAQSLRWFKFSGTAASLPEFGLGVATTYYTAYIKAIISRPQRGDPGEVPQVGGVTQQGALIAQTRESIGPTDMLEFGTTRYRVEGEPVPVFLGATHFYRQVLRRAE